MSILSKFYTIIENSYRINRDMKEGDLAPYAHQNVREFPDWYKPYGFNY